MLNAPDATSTRPYLLRAMHEWCTDHGYTPYMAVVVDGSVQVPMEFVKGGEIVLNVGFEATSGLTLGKAVIVNLPGEPLIDYQFHAQSLLPDGFVAVAGYGDGATGYICTAEEFAAGGYEAAVSICTPGICSSPSCSTRPRAPSRRRSATRSIPMIPIQKASSAICARR